MNNKSSQMTKNITIVGAGVIGAASALALQKAGHKVTLIDRDHPAAGTSFGNAGAIVNGSCIPTATPGIIYDVCKMVTKPLPPLSIKPAYFHKILPWLIRFTLQSKNSSVLKNAKHLQALSKHAVSSWRELLANTDLLKLFRETGWLKLYQSDESFSASKKSLQLLDNLGTDYEILTPAQIHDLESNIAPIFKHGFYQKDSLSVSNPQKLVQGMVDLLVAQGGSYQQFAVDKISMAKQKVMLTNNKDSIIADKVIIATGAWSKSLAAQLGDIVPLDTERGYHMMFATNSSDLLKRPVVNVDKSFVLSPMTTGMRMTSQIEFAGLLAPPNYKRIRSLLPSAKQMLPKLETQEKSVWMGCRPSLPDSLPVIGYAKSTKQVIYAFGHQHLGMTLAAITSQLVSDLVQGKQPQIPIAAYSPNRFKLL